MTQGTNAEFMNNLLSNCSGYLFIMDPCSLECYMPGYILQGMEEQEQGIDIESFAGQILQEKDCRRFVDDCRRTVEGEPACLVKSYERRPGTHWGTGESVCVRMWMLEAGNDASGRYLIGMVSQENPGCSFDLVTGIPNNDTFRKRLSGQVRQGENGCVLMLGLDDFSNINELYSYSVGNLFLRACASRIQKLLPDCGSLFRLDGDKFGILFLDSDGEKGKAWYQAFRENCNSEKFCVDGHTLFLSVSGGLCCFPEDGEDLETIYHNAGKALQKSKKNGKGHLVVYSQEMADKDKRTAGLLEALRESVIMGFRGFYMKFQPIVSAQGLDLVGGESLTRWRCPEFSGDQEVSPSEFIPIMEQNGMILEMGNWVLETAVRQCSQWIQYVPDFQMHINMSSRQFEVPSFKYHLLDLLSRYGVKPSNIMLELTESGKVQEPSLLSKEFAFIRSQGIRIALDDFGTGYSSLEVLRLLSADEMKIDRSFLERISYDTTDQALLSTLINLSHKMNMAVCVEGIENEQLQDQVCRMKPDLLQGYFYSVPLMAEEFAAKYFTGASDNSLGKMDVSGREYSQSLVYAKFRPAQSLNSRELLDNASAGIFQVGMDEKFTFLSCNEGYRRMLGYTSQEMDELFANRALGVVHEDDIQYVNDEVRRQLGMGDTINLEFRVVRKDGASVWILGTGNVYRSGDGSPSLIAVIIDIDRKKRILLKQEQTYLMHKKMLDNLPAGVKCVRVDADFTIEYISRGIRELTGYTNDDIARMFDNKFINMIYEEDRALVINDILEQQNVNNVFTVKHRIRCKDGRLICLETLTRICAVDNDGIQRAFSVVVDVTDTPKGIMEEERGLNMARRYETVSEQWGEYFMEYDFSTEMAVFSDNFNRIFGYPGKIASETMLEAIHKEDVSILRGAIREARDGARPNPFEVRLFIPGESYHWFSVAMTPPDRLGNKPVTVLAKILDINEEKREKERLLLIAQQDSTTALMSKACTEEKIRDILGKAGPDRCYALFVIDIDHFRNINDAYGHIAGDEVLRIVADYIRQQFRPDDIIGRMGGDEYLILLPYSGDIREVIRKAEGIKAAVRQPVLISEVPVTVTVSMGIACYPQDGTDFYRLYHSADRALYRRKSMDRNGYCLAAQFHLEEEQPEYTI